MNASNLGDEMGRKCPQFGCVKKLHRRSGSNASKTEKFKVLYEKQGGICAICLKPMVDGGNLDHIIPASLGGGHLCDGKFTGHTPPLQYRAWKFNEHGFFPLA